MPQNTPTPFRSAANTQAPANLDAEGNLLTSSGDTKSALNITAATVIKATPGRLAKIIIVAPGSGSGAFTFNDCATTGAASAANTVFTLAYNATANVAGAVINLDWPFLVGIVLSAVPGAGAPTVSVSYT
jgi:hypothetical protein